MNALRQKTLELGSYTLQGFSISGLATYIQAPELDLCFDLGECPLSAVGINHIFLSHAHGDHSRCLMRHFSLRRMMGIEHDAYYYMPEYLVENFKKMVYAEAIFEGVNPEKIFYPKIVPIADQGEECYLQYRKDLIVKGFNVKHSVPSMGFTIYRTKKKLKQEFLGLKAQELIDLRNQGTVLEHRVTDPELTFIGDCLGESLWEQEHIWDSRVVCIECTFIFDDEKDMARRKGHTHISEISHCLSRLGDRIRSQKIVLKHFSMKYSKAQVLAEVERQIPKEFLPRILVLL